MPTEVLINYLKPEKDTFSSSSPEEDILQPELKEMYVKNLKGNVMAFVSVRDFKGNFGIHIILHFLQSLLCLNIKICIKSSRSRPVNTCVKSKIGPTFYFLILGFQTI
jgi:hypothetical protein